MTATMSLVSCKSCEMKNINYLSALHLGPEPFSKTRLAFESPAKARRQCVSLGLKFYCEHFALELLLSLLER